MPASIKADIHFIKIDGENNHELMPAVDRIISNVHGPMFNHKSNGLIWELDEVEFIRPYTTIAYDGEQYACEYGLEFKCYPEDMQRMPCTVEYSTAMPKIAQWMKKEWLEDGHFNTFIIKEDRDEPATKILSEDVRGSISIFPTRNGGSSKTASKSSRSKPEDGR